jgi:SAM-dependent methyltransferase
VKHVDRILQQWRIRRASPWIRNGARVLDVGCFDDALFAALGRRLGSGVGVDPLLTGPVERDRFRLMAGHFPDVQLADSSFDAITMLAVLEHVPPAQLGRWAQVCARLLVPGGVVVATVPAPAVDHILAVLMRLRIADGMSVEEHHGFKPEVALAVFLRAGFVLAHQSRFQLGLNNLFVFAKQAP